MESGLRGLSRNAVRPRPRGGSSFVSMGMLPRRFFPKACEALFSLFSLWRLLWIGDDSGERCASQETRKESRLPSRTLSEWRALTCTDTPRRAGSVVVLFSEHGWEATESTCRVIAKEQNRRLGPRHWPFHPESGLLMKGETGERSGCSHAFPNASWTKYQEACEVGAKYDSTQS